VKGTTDWRKYALKLRSGADIKGVPALRFILLDATGKAWIDDVKIVPVEK